MMGVDQRELGLELGGAARPQLRDQVGNDGVWTVTQLVRRLADDFAGRFGNGPVPAQRQRHGILRVADLVGNDTHGDGGHDGGSGHWSQLYLTVK
jgi:hypothetical protein